MSNKLVFLEYNGTGFLEYLLNSRQAKSIEYDGKTLTITLSSEYDRLSKKQKAEVIKARLAESIPDKQRYGGKKQGE